MEQAYSEQKTKILAFAFSCEEHVVPDFAKVGQSQREFLGFQPIFLYFYLSIVLSIIFLYYCYWIYFF
jgi:hypothetical protein